MVNNPSPTVEVPLLTLDRKRLAAELCTTTKTIDRWCAAGQLPKPLRIGGRKLWDRSEIVGWIAEGCPSREQWQPIWEAKRKGGRR